MGFAVVLALFLLGLLAGGVSHQKTKNHTSFNPKTSVTSTSQTTFTAVPTPALLPGMVVFLGSVLRKKKKDS